MTDFCPYSSGIVPIIEQYLLPYISGDLEPIPSRPKVASKYNLATSQMTEILRTLETHTRTVGDFIVTDDMRQYFMALGILPQSTEEWTQLHTRLNKFGSGFTLKEDLIDEAAIRIASKPPAPEPSSSKQPTTKVELGGNDENRRVLSRGIRAELYKLNVYSGPSGHFKSHVDTPRSDMQIGSLVVCLPVEFSGGALAVRHQGREVRYKWGRHDPAIRWAAFYSDCEHEVFQVNSGHRVTLTYNLFLAPGTGLLAGAPKPLDTPSMPLFGQLKQMLSEKNFLNKGGYLGICLAHSYPHTHDKLNHFVPSMLKGSDMALYETLSKLGLPFILDPINKASFPSATALATLDELSYGQHSQEEPPTFVSTLRGVEIVRGIDESSVDYDDPDVKNAGSFKEFLESNGYDDYLHRDEDNGDEDVDENVHDSDEEWISRLPRSWQTLKTRMEEKNKITWVNRPGKENEELSKAYVAVSFCIHWGVLFKSSRF